MRIGEFEEEYSLNCATCMHSKFKKFNLHTCNHHEMEVDGDAGCYEWEPLIILNGEGALVKFGSLCGCSRCRV